MTSYNNQIRKLPTWILWTKVRVEYLAPVLKSVKKVRVYVTISETLVSEYAALLLHSKER